MIINYSMQRAEASADKDTKEVGTDNPSKATSPQHEELKDDALLRSPTPTLKTDSVETIDSASLSSPAPSSSASHPSSPSHYRDVKSGPTVSNQQLQISLKILVSNSASGSIIGRSGSTISELQTKSQTRIKLSQGGDYYPGTNDRVCLIQGSLSNASEAVEMILGKLYDLQSYQQQQQPPPTTKTKTSSEEGSYALEDEIPAATTTSSFMVRILIPTTCCGMIIGLGGSNIKSLKEKSKVTYIQLSPKKDDLLLLSSMERIMTITGPSFASCVSCIQIILNDMALNPEISWYINMTTSYSKNLLTQAAQQQVLSAVHVIPSSMYVAASSVPGYYPDDPYQQHHQAHLESHARYGHEQYTGLPPRYNVGGEQYTGLPRIDPNVSLLSQELSQHEGSPTMMGHSGDLQPHQPSYVQVMLPPPSRIEGINPTSSSFPQYMSPSSHATQSTPSSHATQSTQFLTPQEMPSPATGHMSPVDQLNQSFQTQASIQSYPSYSSLTHLSTSSGHQQQQQGLFSIQLGIPDNEIGAILGRQGSRLSEIQKISKTRIRISQRGNFIPGTNNRVVTITGSTAEGVNQAVDLVNEYLTSGAVARRSSSFS